MKTKINGQSWVQSQQSQPKEIADAKIGCLSSHPTSIFWSLSVSHRKLFRQTLLELGHLEDRSIYRYQTGKVYLIKHNLDSELWPPCKSCPSSALLPMVAAQSRKKMAQH